MQREKKEETRQEETRSETLSDEQLETVAGGGPHVRVFNARVLPG